MTAPCGSGFGKGVRRVADEARAWVRGLLVELAAAAGATDPERLAQQLVLIYDGATVGSYMDDAPQVVKSARALAATLVDAAIAKRDRSRLGSARPPAPRAPGLYSV